MTDQNNSPEGLTLSDAGAAIAGFLSEPEDKKDTRDAPKPPKPEKEQKPVKEPTPKPEAKETEVEPDADGDEPEPKKVDDEELDDEGDEPDEKLQSRKFKVKADGQELEVEEDELVKGYSRTADYTRKTQAHAERIKKFEAEELAPVRAERQQYAERLAALAEAVKSLVPEEEPDWGKLREELTPDEYASTHSQYQTQKQRMDRIRAEQKRVNDLQVDDAVKQLRARVEIEKGELVKVLPDWADAEKGPALRKDLKDYAVSIGFAEDDLDGVTNHRLIVLLNKARLHDEAAKRKPKIEEKIDKAVNDALKPNGTPPKRKVTKATEARQRLAKSGSIEDAAAAIALEL